MSQCNTDGQCPSLSLDIGSRPSRPFCCDEVRVFYSYFCSGTNASLIPALTGCAEKPNCVAQPPATWMTTTPAASSTPPTPTPSSPTPTPTPSPLPSLAPTLTPTPTPTPTPASLQVKISLTLPMTPAAFNASVQQTFREQMALAAGLPKADAAARVLLAVRAAARRRLLDGGSVAVDVTISMPDAAAAKAAVASLTESKINARLAEAGLPPAAVTSPAATGAALPSGAEGPPPRLARASAWIGLAILVTAW
jgi:hypothetical protein